MTLIEFVVLGVGLVYLDFRLYEIKRKIDKLSTQQKEASDATD